MFSFRLRSTKKQDDRDQPRIHTSPSSLPQLRSQGILPWPENLVDVASIRASTVLEEEAAAQHQGAAKTSFQGAAADRPIPFHKPFQALIGKPVNGGSIPSLYMTNVATFAPSPFVVDNRKSTATSAITTAGRQSQRRTRNPPTFNIMASFSFHSLSRVTKCSDYRRPGRGWFGHGQNLETVDISPTATIDQQATLGRFLHGPTKRTHSIQTACVKICQSRFVFRH